MVWHQVCHTACRRTPVSPRPDPCAAERWAAHRDAARRRIVHPPLDLGHGTALKHCAHSVCRWRFLGNPAEHELRRRHSQRAAHPRCLFRAPRPKVHAGPPLSSPLGSPRQSKGQGTEAGGTAPLSQHLVRRDERVVRSTTSSGPRGGPADEPETVTTQHGHWHTAGPVGRQMSKRMTGHLPSAQGLA